LLRQAPTKVFRERRRWLAVALDDELRQIRGELGVARFLFVVELELGQLHVTGRDAGIVLDAVEATDRREQRVFDELR
jgi:hypothetical protein